MLRCQFRLLLATTALAGLGLSPAIAQTEGEGLSVGVSGFMRQYVSFQANNGNQSLNPVDQWSDSEIHFSASAQVSEGIEVGLDVELETDQGPGEGTIDQSYLYVETAFGRLEMGGRNSAGYLMHIEAPNVGPAINSGRQGQSIGDQGRTIASTGGIGPFAATYLEPIGSSRCTDVNADGTIDKFLECTFSADDNGQKITYFTPRLHGFQVGVSLLPDITVTGGNANAIDPDPTHDYGASVGLNYIGEYGNGVTVSGSLGYYFSRVKDGVLDTTGRQADDFHGITAGVRVGYEGFSIGASTAHVLTEGIVEEGFVWDFGVAYEADRWGLSLTYIDSDLEVDEFNQLAGQLSGRYRLGNGVDVVAYGGYAAIKGRNGGGLKEDGIYGGTGLELTF